jgi:hypothetical protein
VLDRFTNYRTQYGYPTWPAFWGEVWWRLEHLGYRTWIRCGGGVDDPPWPLLRLWSLAYYRRKDWERIGQGRPILAVAQRNVEQVLGPVERGT